MLLNYICMVLTSILLRNCQEFEMDCIAHTIGQQNQIVYPVLCAASVHSKE